MSPFDIDFLILIKHTIMVTHIIRVINQGRNTKEPFNEKVLMILYNIIII